MPNPSLPAKYYGDSEGSSNEEAKRKAEDELENSSRNKKTFRTPERTVKLGKGENSGNEELKNMLREMMGDIKDLRKDQKEQQKEFQKMREEMKELKVEQHKYYEEVRTLKQENGELKHEISNINKRLERLDLVEHQYERMDREKRKKNLMITGLDTRANGNEEIKSEMETFLREKLNVEVKIDSATKISNKHCLITTASLQDKIGVLKNKSKLRSMEEQKNVFINNDLTVKEREIQSKIRKIAEEERKAGKAAKTGYQKLITNGQLWKWDERKDKLVMCNNKELLQKNAPKND